MSLTSRDRKIVLVLAAVVTLAAYWFLLLSPKREDAAKAASELTEQEERRDQASAQLAELESARTTFAADYSNLVCLGKAIPSSVDSPSLIVQIERAARGTQVGFDRIASSDRAAAAPTAAPPGGASSKPAAPGGAPAESAPGTASESAGNAVSDSNAKTEDSAAQAESTDQGGVTAEDAQTSKSTREGGLPVGGGAAPGGAEKDGTLVSPTAPGLKSVPFEFNFDGDFFDLADFFHELKRYVRVAHEDVDVRGRLMTIDALRIAPGGTGVEGEGDGLVTEVFATVYLTPKSEGLTAGATPEGPAGAAPEPERAVAQDGATPSTGGPTAAVTP